MKNDILLINNFLLDAKDTEDYLDLVLLTTEATFITSFGS